MRLLILPLFCALFLCVAQASSSCLPDDEQISKIITPLVEKFNSVVCGQGIKPGGQEDLGFVSEIVLPYYLSKNWLGIDLPKGLGNKILAKCYNINYNFCDEGRVKNFEDCVKGFADSFLLKYGALALGLCPTIDEKVQNWVQNGDSARAAQFFTQYCASKGRMC